MRYRYDYYTIALECDIFDESSQTYTEDMASLAIDQASEQSRLYCIPAMWTSELVEETRENYMLEFKVRRKRVA